MVRLSTRSTSDIYTRNTPPSWAVGLTNKPIPEIHELKHFTGWSDQTSPNYLAQIGPVRTTLFPNSLHGNGHNSLHITSIDVPFVAYESRLDKLSIHI